MTQPEKTVDPTKMITNSNSCVGCGYCCTKAACPFGVWDQEAKQCESLLPPNEQGQRLCGAYDEIVASGERLSPAFGAGCSSSLCNDLREDLMRKLAPLKWVLWGFSPGLLPDQAYKEFTHDIIAHTFEAADAWDGRVTDQQKEALTVFRSFLDGKASYEEVTAARKAAWHGGSPEEVSPAVMLCGALMMDSLGLVRNVLVSFGHLLDVQWMADRLYELIQNNKTRTR